MNNHNEDKNDKEEAIKELIRFAELRFKNLQDEINLVEKYKLIYIFAAFALIGFFMQMKKFDGSFYIIVLFLGIIATGFLVGIIATKKSYIHTGFTEEIIKKNLSVMETQKKILSVYSKEIARLEKVQKNKVRNIKFFIFPVAYLIIGAFMFVFAK